MIEKAPKDKLREKLLAFILICRQEGVQNSRWKLDADVEDLEVIIKEGGYRQLDPDQSLPDIPQYFAHDSSFTLSIFDTYRIGQQDMLKVNFRRVKE